MKNWKMEIISFFKKLIPAHIEIRSLYWIQYEKSMDKELVLIFEKIDSDEYENAKELIEKFHENHSQSTVPFWVAKKMAEIYRAESMLNFLIADNEKQS